MSTGISISSINRIKELAEEKKFKEALEILDTQNLDKSINPQFLRISGEIFRENKRYYDSRRILLKAHQMAPQGNRIIYELIRLYLELGYYTKAKQYYEQYKFYMTPDDTLKEYVEYTMKKALGTDVRELASILIPILERMPEDRWNFEAVLLYHKLGRKDKALDESRYILENFKESEYVRPVIDYIEDKLDVDQYFYVYPLEEQIEDTEQFGDLIELEEKILEADLLRMYPPEARIMVEAEDKEAAEYNATREKKSKKTKKKTSKSNNNQEDTKTVASDLNEADKSEKQEVLEDYIDKGVLKQADDISDMAQHEEISQEDNTSLDEEQQLKLEREAALETLLSKKIDKDKIRESAKQVAKAMKEIDANKAKQQVKVVADTVRDNVKKATDVLSEAVGTKQLSEENGIDNDIEELIVDGIIEGVLEAPPKPVGQVIMNEELDALIPDSLEAMSEEEVALIEARREEAERVEQEALEAAKRYDEEKKSKRAGKTRKIVDAEEDSLDGVESADNQEGHNASLHKKNVLLSESDSLEKTQEMKDEKDLVYENDLGNSEVETNLKDKSYNELRNQYINDLQEDEIPLESLGFISVVHSDVDELLENDIPETADMIRQVLDDKEYYVGESSLGFETKASYNNHGFEIEDYDFEAYKSEDEIEREKPADLLVEQEEPSPVQVIFAQKPVLEFEAMVSEELSSSSVNEKEIQSEKTEVVDVEKQQSTILQEEQKNNYVSDGTNNLMKVKDDVVEDITHFVSDNKSVEDLILEEVEKRVELLGGNIDVQEMLGYKKKREERRKQLRMDIVLSSELKNKLLELKGSR